MSLGADVLSGVIVDSFAAIVEQHRINRWTKLIISLAVTFVCAFSFADGGALVGGASPWRAFGVGLTSAALCTATQFYRSDLTKGVSITVPKDMVEQEAMKDGSTYEVKGGQGK